MRIDLHTHTLLSDGCLLPIEMARRAAAADHSAIAFTDHVSFSTLERVIEETRKDCEVTEEWGIHSVLGVEITHVPTGRIDEIVSRARELGAELIVVHGETTVEPVERGTNRIALENPEVDILAHPGLITEEEALLARENNIVLELTSRRGHCRTNGHVAKKAEKAGAELVVNTDAHSSEDLLTEEGALRLARGAGLSKEGAERAVNVVPNDILRRIREG